MSLAFNDLTNQRGIIQIYEKEAGFNRGDISGNATRLLEVTADINLAWDRFVQLAIQASGTWQFDDSNHAEYPEITTDLLSGQRDYSFTTDGEGALILDFYRVMVADPTGFFREIEPVDQQANNREVGTRGGSGNIFPQFPGTGINNTNSFIDGQNKEGTPSRYDKTANGLFLDLIPNYNRRLIEEGEGGIKIFINREASYFVSTDTTKKPGAPGILHEYFAIQPAFQHARRNSLANKNDLAATVLQMEDAINTYFGKREKDIVRRLIPRYQNNK